MVIYVDDLIIINISVFGIEDTQKILNKVFDRNNFGQLHYFFDIQVRKTQDGILLSQSKCACDFFG
jgi:hypothetical protein